MAADGFVAQLGERTVRIRKVEGSIPFESTKNRHPSKEGCRFFADSLFTNKPPICSAAHWFLLPIDPHCHCEARRAVAISCWMVTPVLEEIATSLRSSQ